MAAAANKVLRRKLDNALFVQAAVERLPPELAGTADRITVNFPWGSLLKTLAAPDRQVLSDIAGLGKPGAAVTILVNMSVFDDDAYCARAGLSCPPVFADPGATRALYGRAGLDVTRIVPDLTVMPYRTSWGQKLTKGTRRRVLRLDATIAGRRS